MQQLRDLGNTVIVVEHEEEVIRAADYIVDIGPKAGYNGGEVVFSGTLPQLLKSRKSLTADYLTGRRAIAPARHRTRLEQLDRSSKGRGRTTCAISTCGFRWA